MLGCGLNEHFRGLLRYCGLDCKPRQIEARGSPSKPNSLTVSITETVEMRTGCVEACPSLICGVGLCGLGRTHPTSRFWDQQHNADTVTHNHEVGLG